MQKENNLEKVYIRGTYLLTQKENNIIELIITRANARKGNIIAKQKLPVLEKYYAKLINESD